MFPPAALLPTRYNFWGYSTVNFFSPMGRYSAALAEGRPVNSTCNEFKQLVKECHRRGIEVRLCVGRRRGGQCLYGFSGVAVVVMVQLDNQIVITSHEAKKGVFVSRRGRLGRIFIPATPPSSHVSLLGHVWSVRLSRPS